MTETILWRRVDLPGHEIATLQALDEDWKLSGTAIFLSEQGLAKLDYVVICDSSWQTNSAQVNGVIGSNAVSLTVSANADRRWHVNGVPRYAVEGCIDIDLGFSPSTNLLRIRRHALLELNAAGFVTSYPDLWQAEGRS